LARESPIIGTHGPCSSCPTFKSPSASNVDKLGFKKKWDAGDGTVCQVDRGGCEIILCEDRARQDKSRLFVELTRHGIDELRREISERSVPTEKAWWGYDAIRIVDPDGNELLFPLDETNDRERRR